VDCAHCSTPLPPGSRRDRRYCDNKCRAWASIARRKAGVSPPSPWQHPALESANPALQAAAVRARQLGEAHGWDRSTLRLVLDGLTVVLDGRPAGERVTLTEVRTRTPRHASSPRVAEVLDDLELLDDDTTPAIRQWIHRRASELPAGFAEAVRAWLGVLLDGDARTRPRSQPTLYVYFADVRPFLERWSADRGHLREVTADDVEAALEPLCGYQRRNAITALRSLFRFAKRRGLVFANPTLQLATSRIDPSLLPMTDPEIRAVQQVAGNPAQRLIVALAAVHATRIAAIRHLLLDDLDLPNRRITIAGHTQRVGELTERALRAWLNQRRTAWPHTPNQHVLISGRTALEVAPISKGYFHYHLRRHGVDLDRIRRDRILHEALTAGPDPLRLSLVFNLSHTTASRYVAIAEDLLDGQLEQPAEH
jgi:site-specific recombinase XerD